MRFDVLAEAKNGDTESVTSKCNYTWLGFAVDVSQKALINYNISQEALNAWLKTDHSQAYEPPANDSFGNDITTTNRWLIAMGLAFFYDMFVIYIIKLYFKTFITIFLWKPDNKDEAYFWANDHFFLKHDYEQDEDDDENTDKDKNNDNNQNTVCVMFFFGVYSIYLRNKKT